MTSGNLSISNTGDDGVQAAFKDDTDREAEDTGSITISGGTVTIDVTATAAKALKADGSVFVTNGTLTLSTSGGGMWDAEDGKTHTYRTECDACGSLSAMSSLVARAALLFSPSVLGDSSHRQHFFRCHNGLNLNYGQYQPHHKYRTESLGVKEDACYVLA